MNKKRSKRRRRACCHKLRWQPKKKDQMTGICSISALSYVKSSIFMMSAVSSFLSCISSASSSLFGEESVDQYWWVYFSFLVLACLVEIFALFIKWNHGLFSLLHTKESQQEWQNTPAGQEWLRKIGTNPLPTWPDAN